MMYLIAHLSLWLLLTAAFAVLAGWSFAALRAEPAEASARRERDKLMKDLLAVSVENAPAGVPLELDREMDTLRRRADLDAARVAELERALETARDRGSDATARIAELERGANAAPSESQEVARLREELADLKRDQEAAMDVEATPVADDSAALQTWRLRYFEQRVRYLENNKPATPEPAPPPIDPTWEWRARTAEARVTHLEDTRRALLSEPPPAEASPQAEPDSPFAANAETDMLLRWRMLYLEKRVAYLQGEAHAEAPRVLAPLMDAEEAEKWKWRARYLEARTRHLEQQLAAVPEPAPEPTPEPPAPAVQPVAAIVEPPPAAEMDDEEDAAPEALVPPGAERRPPGLAAPRGGAGDDLSLIEGISLLQHSTLNSLGIHHFDQIAAWTPANVAWVDQYLRLRGRISDEEWVEQAEDLVRDGVGAARRLTDEEAL